MEINNSFEVPLPPKDAWKTLMDIPRIAPCMPGAELTGVVDKDTYNGKVSVRLGPVALTFAGQVKFTAIDEAACKARVKAQGKDSKARGGDSLALRCLYNFPPETGQHAALFALKHGLVGAHAEFDDPILRISVWGLDFANPIGLAAGFDKDARVIDAMLSLGFGFVEAGTVTPKPQPGNPKPRLFRLDQDEAVINRLGFNSGGVSAFAKRLAARRGGRHPAGPVGANVGKNRETMDGAADYVAGIQTLAGLAGFLGVNNSLAKPPR